MRPEGTERFGSEGSGSTETDLRRNEQGLLAEKASPFQRLVSGHYGLALTYWVLFLIGVLAFFIFGSMTVAERAWPRFIAMLFASVAYSFLLLVGIQRAYRGNDPGKALGRIAMLFLLLNLSNTLAVLSFLW